MCMVTVSIKLVYGEIRNTRTALSSVAMLSFIYWCLWKILRAGNGSLPAHISGLYELCLACLIAAILR